MYVYIVKLAFYVTYCCKFYVWNLILLSAVKQHLLERSHCDGIKSLPCSSQHPVTWQPSKEGDHLIGRITLSKRTAMPKEAGAMLGLKVRRHTQL